MKQPAHRKDFLEVTGLNQFHISDQYRDIIDEAMQDVIIYNEIQQAMRIPCLPEGNKYL